MSSVRMRRAWRELSRHRMRSVLTVATLAGAMVGVWLFAVPRQMNALMADKVEQDSIHDVRLFPDGIVADADTVARLRSVPGVAALDLKATYFTESQVGDHFQDIYLVGVADFSDQQVNVVGLTSGAAPDTRGDPLEAVSDPQNARTGRLPAGVGDELLVRSDVGGFVPIMVTAIGGSVHYSHGAVEGAPVIYVPIETVWELWPWDDLASVVEFRLTDRSEHATAATIDAVRDELHDIKPRVTYNNLVDVRPHDDWPGKEDFDNFQVLFWVIVAISLLSSLVLVASTATTLVRQQTREIGIMKAIGGTRRQIIGGFAITLGMIGGAGTLVGTLVGYPLTNLLMDVMNREFVGIENDWRFSWFAFGVCIVVGIGGTLLAALPALLWVARTSVRAALDGVGLGGFGGAGADRLVRRLGPLGGRARLGVRNALRNKGRTMATTTQVALAVGTLLGFTALMVTMLEISEESRLAEGGDIEVYSSGRGRRIDAAAIDLAAGVEGVAQVQPTASAQLLVGDTETFTWGLPVDPIYAYEMERGRWFTDADDGAEVAVVGPALANVHDLDVADELTVQTRNASLTLEVVGIDTTMVGDGLAVFLPLSTLLDATGQQEASFMWLTTTSSDHADIDAVGAEVRRLLESRGYGIGLDLRYVEREADRASDAMIIAVIMSMGLPVVAIGMIGLAGAITTSALDRRREIGVLRSIGAARGDIKRIFRTEAVVIVAAGWLVGIALGYVIGRIILLAMNESFDVKFVLHYPIWPIPVSLAITLLIAFMVLARPIGHASRLSPSDSLRYE